MRDGAPRQDAGFSFGLLVAALAPRLYVALAWAHEPVWDGHYYDFGAKRIADGFGYSDEVLTPSGPVWHAWCHYPVGYSGFLALFYAVLGAGPWVGPVANALVGAATAVLVHRLGLRALGVTRARIGGALVALSPGLIVYSALLMTEPLAGSLVLLAAWLVVRAPPERAVRGLVAGGVVLGLATLVRPPCLLLAPFLPLLSPRGADARRSLLELGRAAAIATGVCLATVAPWTARNCRVMDGCALVSTNAGWNLAIGAFPRATGRFESLHGTDGCPVVTGQVQQDRCWMHEGLRWIAEDPARWLGLVPKKLAQTFDHESFPMGYLAEADPAAWPEARRADGRGLLTAFHLALLVAATLGGVARPSWRALTTPGPRARLLGVALQGLALCVVVAFALHAALDPEHPFWPLALALPLLVLAPWPGRPAPAGALAYAAVLVASVAVTHAVFFGEDRYHMVLTPALALLAAAALRAPAADEAALANS